MLADLDKRSVLYASAPSDALRLLDVDADTGLTERQAVDRQQHYGRNVLNRKPRRSWMSLLFEQFRSVIVWLLGAAAAVSILTGDMAEAVAILCVLAINTTIGFTTSLNAIRSMESLFQMSAHTARVRRDGRSSLLPISDLTPGDIVILESGDIVPADLRLLECADFRCNESTLTGESVPITKSTDALNVATAAPDQVNMAFKGTAVTRGTGLGIVALIGSETEFGRIAALAHSAESDKHPLEKRLDHLGESLVWITFALSSLIALAGFLRGMAFADMAQTAIALAVAAVPEGLPVVATLALARGMLRLAHRNVLIERLSAVETLGATTIILTDKTGTITENRMAVSGYLLEGRDVEKVDALAVDTDPSLKRALEIGALCTNAEIGEQGQAGVQTDVGDPMELALLHAAKQSGIHMGDLYRKYPKLEAHPFDPDTGKMVTEHSADGGYLAAGKGVSERIL